MPYLLIAVGVIARVIPHAWNFTPIGGIGLYAGAHMNARFAWLVPLIALFIGDLILGFYDFTQMALVYVSFLAAPIVGRLFLRRRKTILRFGGAVFSAATLHFLISNIGSWLALYPQTLDGLIQCYVLALPFYGATLLGDSIFAAIFFGCHEFVQRYSRQHSNLAGA